MKDYTLAAFYFPNFHPDQRNEDLHGKGWSEWNLIRSARPRFPGHYQPQCPLWGEEDESDPEVMNKKINIAADHSLDVWLFDWYHYDDGPFLNQCLDRGFLNAPDRNRMKFALMWANHDWYRIHGWDPRSNSLPPLDFPGKVNPETFEKICDLVIQRYFREDNYWKINGCPVFSMYELGTFASAYNSMDEVKMALDVFRKKTREAGFPDLHLNLIYWGMPNLPGARTPKDWNEIIQQTGVDSTTSYTWVHHGALNEFPETAYAYGAERYFNAIWPEARKLPVPYFPNITLGWDNSPRCAPDILWQKRLPHVVTPTIIGNTPAEFEKTLRLFKSYMDQHPELPKVITINAWNEWPEGSRLEPEARYGYGYLQALRQVFSN